MIEVFLYRVLECKVVVTKLALWHFASNKIFTFGAIKMEIKAFYRIVAPIPHHKFLWLQNLGILKNIYYLIIKNFQTTTLNHLQSIIYFQILRYTNHSIFSSVRIWKYRVTNEPSTKYIYLHSMENFLSNKTIGTYIWNRLLHLSFITPIW